MAVLYMAYVCEWQHNKTKTSPPEKYTVQIYLACARKLFFKCPLIDNTQLNVKMTHNSNAYACVRRACVSKHFVRHTYKQLSIENRVCAPLCLYWGDSINSGVFHTQHITLVFLLMKSHLSIFSSHFFQPKRNFRV